MKPTLLVAAIVAMVAGIAGGAFAPASAQASITMPDVRYDTVTAAETALHNAGLTMTLATSVVDPYCNNLGDVVAQNPAPGSDVNPGALVTVSLGIAPATCPSRQKFLFVNVGWNAGGTTPASSLDPEEPLFRFFHGVMNAWFNQVSLGKFPGFEIVDGGSYVIDTPTLTSSGVCGFNFVDQVFARARTAAAAHGFDTSVRLLVHWSSRSVCTNLVGLTDPNQGVLLQGPGSRGQPAMHEFGHVLGLAHAGLLTCTDAFGAPVPLSNTCTLDPTGDWYSTMRGGDDPQTETSLAFAASHMNQLGWLDGRFDTVQAQDATFHEVIKPMGDASSGLHAVKLVDGRTLWLEYRLPIGLDVKGYGHGSPGLVVYMEAPGSSDTAQLLDMQPVEATFNLNYDLPVGQTWVNPLGVMKVTLDSVDSAGAHVTVSSQLVTVPNVLFMSLQDARSAIEGMGLVWGGTTPELTTNCDLVGSITGQSPAAGSRQLPGTIVTVAIGQLDPKRHCF